MFKKKTLNLSIICSMVFGILVTAFSTSILADGYFNIANGKLDRPTGYREWVYVGTPVTPNDMNNGKAAFPEFHNVYSGS